MKTINFKGKTGQIIWVHPKKRFILVEFKTHSRFGVKKYRECFKIVNNKILVA